MKERGIADEVIKRFIKEKVIKFLISNWGRVHLHVKKKKKTPKTQMQCPKKNSLEDEVSNHRIYHS